MDKTFEKGNRFLVDMYAVNMCLLTKTGNFNDINEY